MKRNFIMTYPQYIDADTCHNCGGTSNDQGYWDEHDSMNCWAGYAKVRGANEKGV